MSSAGSPAPSTGVGAPPDLLVVAHGTHSAAGTTVLDAVVADIARRRPDVRVRRCFLDVARPSLPEGLADVDRPTVLVPLLLSTGYHVEHDIPDAVGTRTDVAVARHLGPHPLLTDALADRLPSGDGPVTLVGAGSTRPGAAPELAEAGRLLSHRLRERVDVTTVGPGLADALADGRRAACYLLAPGRFHDMVRDAAPDPSRVADPIGVHPALSELVWRRYDQIGPAAL